jgi:hypothetical protein
MRGTNRPVLFGTLTFPEFPSHKHKIIFKCIGCPRVDENICRRKIGINRPLRGGTRRRRGRCVDSDCGVWTEMVDGSVKKGSVTEQS